MNATRIDEIQRLLRITETAKAREVYEPTCVDSTGLRSTNPKKSIRDGVLPASRHLELLQLLQTRGQATINELAAWLDVSGATVRRDLDRLAGQKRLTRTYGGAMVNGGALPCSLGFGDRMHAPERRIAQAACRLIADGETVLVNAGETVRRIASELAQKRLTVITNDLCLPAALPSHLKVYVLGGEYVCGAQATKGPLVVSGAEITVDSALISVEGVTVAHGLTTATLEEAWMISAMMQAARRTIVMVVGTKLGKTALGRVGALDKMQVLVTDEPPLDDLAYALMKARVKVIVATDN
jgi:DeoR/GlpR family transcriptional regulator of sugar metabolism